MYSIHQTYFLVQKRLEQKLLEIKGITFSQFLILLPLHCKERAKEHASQADIAEFLHLTEATVSRHISSLEKDKMLTRKEDPENRRKHMLELTTKGAEEFSRAHKIIETELKSIFEVIPTGDRTQIIHTFDIVLKKLLSKK